MTRHFLTRFIATGLILIGHSVFASEINQRSDTETTTFFSSVQASPAELLDNTDDQWQSMLTDATAEHTGVNRKYLTLSFTTATTTPSPKHTRYNPRAPPSFSL